MVAKRILAVAYAYDVVMMVIWPFGSRIVLYDMWRDGEDGIHVFKDHCQVVSL